MGWLVTIFRAYSYYNRTGGNDDDERPINGHTAAHPATPRQNSAFRCNSNHSWRYRSRTKQIVGGWNRVPKRCHVCSPISTLSDTHSRCFGSGSRGAESLILGCGLRLQGDTNSVLNTTEYCARSDTRTYPANCVSFLYSRKVVSVSYMYLHRIGEMMIQ